jgi:hypothetical protein
VPIYRLHDTTGEDLGLLEHPAPNLEPGDVVVLADGREADDERRPNRSAAHERDPVTVGRRVQLWGAEGARAGCRGEGREPLTPR